LHKALKGAEGSGAFIVDMDLNRGAASRSLYLICKEAM